MKNLLMLLLISSFAVSAQAQSDAENTLATPAKGEGIYSLLRSNGVKPSAVAVADFKKINAGLLNSNGGLKMNVDYRLPARTNIKTYPIFGTSYQDVEIKNTTLQGHVYYLVSGHGGPDPGAQGSRGGQTLSEDEYAYDTMLRTARGLIAQSATVYIIVRDTDGIRDIQFLPGDKDEKHLGGHPISRKQLTRLRDRVSIINRLYNENRKTARSQQLIEIHVDSRISKSTQIDVNFYYSSNGGRALSSSLQNTFRSEYDRVQPGRNYNGKIVERGGLYMLRETRPVSILIELANIQHRGDQVRITKPENRQTLADWIVTGLIADSKK
jgi:N-acetylmuramoyl-L-alanine amidase